MARIIAGPIISRQSPWGKSDHTEWTHLTEHVLGDENDGGMFGFYVRWKVADHWADVAVFKIESHRAPDADGGDPPPLFEDKDGHEVDSIDKAEPYIDGYIKADGCSELSQGGDHWCGVDGFVRHCALLKYLWRRSRELMHEPEEAWPTTEPKP